MRAGLARGEAREFVVFGRRIAARQWGAPEGIPTLALHGWLDNANTFVRLAPRLPELNVIALDFAGHGASDHRAPGEHYHAFTDMQDVLAVADQLGWARFNLLGHSMGASIASELAGVFPERVARVLLIDGIMATGGVTWRTDPRIRYPTPLRHTREQLDVLLARSSAPALLIVAEQGDEWYQGEISDAQQWHPQLTVVRMSGPHHIHLEPAFVDRVAGEIRSYLDLGPLPADVTEQIEWDGNV